MGLIIRQIEAATMNDDWQKEFVADKEVTNKELSITDLAFFLDFKEPGKEVTFEKLTADWGHLSEAERFKRFHLDECTF